MKKYVCTLCGYIYDPVAGDPSNGIDPGTPFEELPDDGPAPSAEPRRTCSKSRSEFLRDMTILYVLWVLFEPDRTYRTHRSPSRPEAPA